MPDENNTQDYAFAKPPLPTREQLATMRRREAPTLDTQTLRAAWYMLATDTVNSGGPNFAMFFAKEIVRAADGGHLLAMVFGKRPSSEHEELTRQAWAAWTELREDHARVRAMAARWAAVEVEAVRRRRADAAERQEFEAERARLRQAARERRAAETQELRKEANAADRLRLARLALSTDLTKKPRGLLEQLARSLGAPWTSACADGELRAAIGARADEVLRGLV